MDSGYPEGRKSTICLTHNIDSVYTEIPNTATMTVKSIKTFGSGDQDLTFSIEKLEGGGEIGPYLDGMRSGATWTDEAYNTRYKSKEKSRAEKVLKKEVMDYKNITYGPKLREPGNC